MMVEQPLNDGSCQHLLCFRIEVPCSPSFNRRSPQHQALICNKSGVVLHLLALFHSMKPDIPEDLHVSRSRNASAHPFPPPHTVSGTGSVAPSAVLDSPDCPQHVLVIHRSTLTPLKVKLRSVFGFRPSHIVAVSPEASDDTTRVSKNGWTCFPVGDCLVFVSTSSCEKSEMFVEV